MKKMIVLAIGAMMLVACGQKGPKAEEDSPKDRFTQSHHPTEG